ncbi:Hypothetical predicted protein, partial [Paramuricea clavata]
LLLGSQGVLSVLGLFVDDNDFSKLLLKVIPLLSNSSLLGRMDEKIMWDSGCLVWISSTLLVAFFMSVSFVSECSKSFVPVWIMKDLGEVESNTNEKDTVTIQTGRDKLLKKSAIYQTGNQDSMTKYQLSINNAAYQLCLEDPSLLHNRGQLTILQGRK